MHVYHKAKITSGSFRLPILTAWAGVMLLLNLFLQSGLFWPLPLEAAPTHAEDFVPNPQAEALFHQQWNRVDGPLVAGQVSRSWLWGPGPFAAFEEDYHEAAPTEKRFVMYFDKARMELSTNPTNNRKPTNGLLVTEMISGQFQLGDNTFQGAPTGPATINVVGDEGDWLTYARLKPYASLNVDNRAPDRTGQSIDQELSERSGVQLFSEQIRAQTFGYYDPNLGHNIAQIFWDFLNQRGSIYYPQVTGYGRFRQNLGHAESESRGGRGFPSST